MQRTTRLALLALLALGLAPGTWLREPIPPPDFRPVLTLETLPLPTRSAGELTIEGVWRLTSPNIHFGSYSALAALPDGGLLAVSDRGRWLRFTPPGRVGRGPRFGVVGDQVVTDKRRVDAEAMTLHPASGRVWIAYEGVNTIERLGLELGPSKHVRPPEMASWPANAGPEAMTRLRDGRFIILGEGSPQWLGDGYPGLLFAGDPVDGAKAEEFGFVPPDSYRATDMATLPDGRVLILLRAIEGVIPPRFSAKLLVADPAGIRAGKAWRGEIPIDDLPAWLAPVVPTAVHTPTRRTRSASSSAASSATSRTRAATGCTRASSKTWCWVSGCCCGCCAVVVVAG